MWLLLHMIPHFVLLSPQSLSATRLHEVMQAIEGGWCTSQLFTLPSGNLQTLTFSPWPIFSPVFTSEGTPSSEFSLYGPALLGSKYSNSTLGPCMRWVVKSTLKS